MKKRLLLIVVTMVVTATGFFLVFKAANMPAEGEITKLSPGPEQSAGKKEDEHLTLDGKYARFNYPNGYRKVPLPKNTSLETINLIGSTAGGGEITVSISTGSLAENSAVRIRQLQNQTYSEKPLSLPNITGIVFTKQPPSFEKAAIVERNGMVASIVVGSTGKDLSDIFDMVTKSFTWK